MADSISLQKREYGKQSALVERRKEVFKLKAHGYSLRDIARRLDITQSAASRDFQWACSAWGDLPENTAEVVKGECLEILRGLAGMLLKDIERQAEAGVVVTTLGADGQLLQQQVRNGIDPRAVSESGRCVERMAKLMGLMDGGIDAAGAATTAIQVTLPAPSAEAFMSPAPEPVDVASEPVESPSGGPEPAAA
ncbi:hypothetical protein SynBIOSE41_03968 [Synechococcus sp. BIOS-E4-1]|uniref:helix-turn-helix domain-containing protein n=1 Tax=Synechococcus sp. BIOS-E4-1 TaxID=1400864 RepID=UPI001649614B|nr:helix-turn-helix domain-containing protein [Synechococcus sp. BIOS-E4-1]QNI56433.1 hypothetical protein SynBIOSE41_03968 [Synechococcus sp. BIOS-E4-1]